MPEDKRLSNDPVWLGHVASWKLELELESRPPRSAKPYATAMLLSLEIFVLDLEQELYFRFIAWVALIACTKHVARNHEVVKKGIQLQVESESYKNNRSGQTSWTGSGLCEARCYLEWLRLAWDWFGTYLT